MVKSSVKKEIVIASIVAVLSIVTGYVIGETILGLLLGSLIYIIWKWVEFHHFYQWYQQGADVENAPLLSGLWEDLSQHVIKNEILTLKKIRKHQNRINQYNITAQALPYAAIILNSSLRIKWANKQAINLLGVSWEDNYNSNILDIIQHEEFNDWLINAKKSNEAEIQIENPLDADIKTYIKMIRLSNNRMLLVARDITEQETLRKSRKAFVDNASHELRTPLTVITGYLEMLIASEDIDSHWKPALKNAKVQADRMEKIIYDMLKLSSMEHERYLERTDSMINMPELLNSIFNDIKNSSIARNYIFHANINSALKIVGDSEEVFSLCSNLLKNAVIHNKQQTKIELQWFLQNDCAQLWICDNGKGIDAKHLPHLTERFYRVDNSRDKNENSTGLGLAIVRQICQNHDASLDIESQPGKGSCFKISFPKSRIVD